MRLAACLVALAVVVLAGASPAVAAWRTQRVATDRSADFGLVGMAGNGRGDAALVYEEDNGIALAVARPGRPFAAPRLLPRSGDYSNVDQVAIDERGNVVVVWNYNDGSQPDPIDVRGEGCCERLRIALLKRGSRHVEGPRTLGAPGLDSYLGALSIVNGRIGVAWSDDSGSVVARFSRRGLTLGRAVRVIADNALSAVPLRTGPVFTFVRESFGSDESETWTLHELRIVHGRARAPRRVFARHSDFAEVAAGSNASGSQVLAWTEPTATRGVSALYAGVRKLGGGIHPRRIARGRRLSAPSVDIAPSGAAIATASHGDREMYVGARRPGHAFGLARRFGPLVRGGYIEDVDVAVNSAGRALIVWTNAFSTRASHLRAAFRSRGGRRVGLHDFGGGALGGVLPQIALDRHGGGRVAWHRVETIRAGRSPFPP
jgi:hypothetical protein